jgi:hypothetical protein
VEQTSAFPVDTGGGKYAESVAGERGGLCYDGLSKRLYRVDPIFLQDLGECRGGDLSEE